MALNVAFDWLAVQPALLYSQKGYLMDREYTTIIQGGTYHWRQRNELRITYLELPVNVVASAGGWQLLAGPYVALALNGRSRQWAEAEENNLPGSVPPYYLPLPAEFDYRQELSFKRNYLTNETISYRRFDGGFNAGPGYRVGPVQMQVAYSHGLKDIDYSDYAPANQVIAGRTHNDFNRHRGWQLHATYFFGSE